MTVGSIPPTIPSSSRARSWPAPSTRVSPTSSVIAHHVRYDVRRTKRVEEADATIGPERHDYQVGCHLASAEVEIRTVGHRSARWPHGDVTTEGGGRYGDVEHHGGRGAPPPPMT